LGDFLTNTSGHPGIELSVETFHWMELQTDSSVEFPPKWPQATEAGESRADSTNCFFSKLSVSSVLLALAEIRREKNRQIVPMEGVWLRDNVGFFRNAKVPRHWKKEPMLKTLLKTLSSGNKRFWKSFSGN
jgi:hypothetical protein